MTDEESGAMGVLQIECDTSKVSDGYHTFEELYDHRNCLFIALMQSHKDLSWRARQHEDGTMYPGWFLAGMHLPTGDISYHLPEALWPLLEGIATHEYAPAWDGHSPAEVIARLQDWCERQSRGEDV